MGQGTQDPVHAAELMGRYCDGERVAFDSLYALVAPRLLGYLVGLIGERATAEDLLQQTFIKIHQARAAYVRGADPVPWFYAIAHRTCIDEMRRRQRSRVQVSKEDDLPYEPRADLSGAAEESGADDGPDPDLVRLTLRALDVLPDNQRQALLLTKIHGHSVAEAAAITGTTPGAIKLRAHRAYVRLRSLLGKEGLG